MYLTKIMSSVVLIVLVLQISSFAEEREGVPEFFRELPDGYCIIRSFFAPEDKVRGVARKLNAGLERLSNTTLRAYGGTVQVNIVFAESEEDASTVFEFIAASKKGDTTGLIRKGKQVFQLVKAPHLLIKKVAYDLGLSEVDAEVPEVMSYRITADIGLVDKSDYMAQNRILNLVSRVETGKEDEEIEREIRELCGGFLFGKSLVMRDPDLEGVKCRFEPPALKIEKLGGGVVKYSFDEKKKRFGIPYVTFILEIEVEHGMQEPAEDIQKKTLLSPTEFWPSDDPEILSLAEQITTGCITDEQKIKNILDWIDPGNNIRLGKRKGTRWGVRNVLENRRGRCCDFADLFVTFCRASGIPSRLVGGWVYQMAGHAWAEVLIDGKHWRQIDPSGGSLEDFGVFYIPYFTSETGRMPVLYLSSPEIEVLNSKG